MHMFPLLSMLKTDPGLLVSDAATPAIKGTTFPAASKSLKFPVDSMHALTAEVAVL
jgi:hypothetical protein